MASSCKVSVFETQSLPLLLSRTILVAKLNHPAVAYDLHQIHWRTWPYKYSYIGSKGKVHASADSAWNGLVQRCVNKA